MNTNHRKKEIIIVFLIVIVNALYGLYSGSKVAADPKSRTPTPTIQSTETANACGVGIFDHDVGIWAEGEYAQSVCDQFITLIREDGDQPTLWDGTLTGYYAYNYDAVCSDEWSNFSYEVVDTGGHRYGERWCRMMVAAFGTSGRITEPDLFNIIGSAQESQQVTLTAEERSWNATLTAEERSWEAQNQGFIATMTAEQRTIDATSTAVTPKR